MFKLTPYYLKYFWSCLLFCCMNYSKAQPINALQQQLNTCKNDSIKVELLLQLADQNEGNITQAIAYCTQATQLARKINNPYSKLYSQSTLAYYYSKNKAYQNAIYNYNIAIEVAQQLKDLKTLADLYSDVAPVYKNKNVLDSSLLYNQKALDIRKKINDTLGVGISSNNVALLYRKKNDWANASIYYMMAIKHFAAIENQFQLSNAYANYGLLFKVQKQFDSAIFYFTKAKPLAQKTNNNSTLIKLQLNTAICLNESGKYTQAFSLLKEIENLHLQNDNENYPWLMYGIGVTHIGIGKLKEGICYLQQALKIATMLEDADYMGSVNLALANAYQQQSKYNLALQHFKEYKNFNDLFYSSINTKNVNELTTRYETKEKQQQIDLLSKDNLLKDLLIKEKKQQMLYNTLGLILVTLAAGITFLLYRNKRKFSNELELKNNIISVSLSEKEVLLKEIHHRVKNNLQVISSLLNLQSKSIIDEKALAALNEGRNRVKSMALIHQNLYRDDNLTGVDIKDYIEKLINSLFVSYNIETAKIKLQTNIEQLQLDVDTVIPLGLIINELISNALKYAFVNKQNGLLQVMLYIQNTQLVLCVKDDGIGMDNDDLNKNNSASIGFKLVQSFLQKLEATMNVEKNNGTTITLTINKYKLT